MHTGMHMDTQIHTFLYSWPDLLSLSKEKASPAFPLTVDLELSYSFQVKNKNTWLLFSTAHAPSLCFLFMGRIMTQEPWEHFSSLHEGCFLEGQWVGRRAIYRSECLHLNTHQGQSSRLTEVLGGKDQKAALFVWYQVQKSGNPVKIIVRFYSLQAIQHVLHGLKSVFFSRKMYAVTKSETRSIACLLEFVNI